MIERYCISRSPDISRLFPDVVLTRKNELICVYIHALCHTDRSRNGIFYTKSSDFGKTWSEEVCLVRGVETVPGNCNFNCPRISRLPDDTLVILCDDYADGTKQHLWYSRDDGETWGEHRVLPFHGIVPDKYRVLSNGRHVFAVHHKDEENRFTQECYFSDDAGVTWNRSVIAQDERLRLCEASLLETSPGTVVSFLRENSSAGYPIFRAVSHDYGTTWEGVYPTKLYCGHRPVSGFYEDGKLMITYRHKQGGAAQNLFAAFLHTEDVLSPEPEEHVRIFPLSYDRAENPDTGYSGWVRLPDGSFYVVNYLVDDAPKAYIQGMRFLLSDVFA